MSSQRQLPLALVTGATGAIGPRVVVALHQSGYNVRTFSLDPPEPGSLPEDTETLFGDITDETAVRAAVAGVDVVIHMAALLHLDSQSPELRPQYERVNVGGTLKIVEAALSAGVRRLVFFSTVAVYGSGRNLVLDEDVVPRPDTPYSETKLVAERIVLDARRVDKQPIGVVLRPGAVYGARIKGNYQRLVHALSRRRFVPIGRGSNRRSLIYDRDLAIAAVLAASHPQAAGRCFNVSDGQYHALRDIIGAICQAIGRRPPRFSLPVWLVRGAVAVAEFGLQYMGRRSRVTRETINKYTEDIAVNSERIQLQLGFIPKYDLAAGWNETILEMRRSGKL